MNNPLFSIIIPVYNVEKYLAICLNSVLAQSFQNYEVILVDDGSRDSSREICDSYCERYPNKIRVLHKQNQGQFSARRTGLSLASGTYVCFLDSDDCWESDTLDKLFEVISQRNDDVILFRWKLMDQNGKVVNDAIPGAFQASGPVDKTSVFKFLISSAALNSLCLKCCKLSLFDIETDYSQYYGILTGEDLLQSIPVLYTAESFYYLADALYRYRVNPTSITHNYQKGQNKALNIVRPMLYGYLEKMGMDTPQNVSTFFRMYLSSLFDEIFAIYNNQLSLGQRYEILDELRSYKFVCLGEKYYGHSDLPSLKRWALACFYRGGKKKLDRYMGVYLELSKAKQTLRCVRLGVKQFLKE